MQKTFYYNPAGGIYNATKPKEHNNNDNKLYEAMNPAKRVILGKGSHSFCIASLLLQQNNRFQEKMPESMCAEISKF